MLRASHHDGHTLTQLVLALTWLALSKNKTGKYRAGFWAGNCLKFLSSFPALRFTTPRIARVSAANHSLTK